MAYLIAQVWGPLLVAALCGAVIGWFWHAARLRPRQKALEAERRRLRSELLDLAVGLQPVTPAAPNGADENAKRRIAELERALAEARGRGAEADVLRARLADLGRESNARSVPAVDVTDYTTRIAALEVEIEAARRKVAEAEALQARVAGLQAPPAESADEADLRRWRMRFFETRTNYLEQQAKAAADDLGAARQRVAALEATPAPAQDDAANQLVWRNRYLTARLKYLEGAAAPAPAPDTSADAEEADRRRWRVRYLEQRLAHVAEAAKAAPVPVDVAPLHARIAELEQKGAEGETAATKLIEAEDEVIRTRWTARYLQSRVNYLETQAEAAQAAEAARRAREADAKAAAEAAARRAQEEAVAKADAASPAPAPAPKSAPEPQDSQIFRMERPAPLSAPRGGAPDDLTVIEGVSRQTEGALRALGVHHYDQIAGWTAAHAAWVNQYLNLGGRIARERWIEQARELADAKH